MDVTDKVHGVEVPKRRATASDTEAVAHYDAMRFTLYIVGAAADCSQVSFIFVSTHLDLRRAQGRMLCREPACRGLIAWVVVAPPKPPHLTL